MQDRRVGNIQFMLTYPEGHSVIEEVSISNNKLASDLLTDILSGYSAAIPKGWNLYQRDVSKDELFTPVYFPEIRADDHE